MVFQLFGTNHLKGNTMPMYTPTDEDVAAVRNAAALLTGIQRSELGRELHQLANRLETGRTALVAAQRATAGMAAERDRIAQAMNQGNGSHGLIPVAAEAIELPAMTAPSPYFPPGDLGDDPDGDASIDPRDT